MDERTYRRRAYALKAVMACLEWWGRLLFFNLASPQVSREVLDVPYDTVNRRKQSLDVFIPKGDPPYPVLVFIHGSGFHVMDKKSYRRVCKCYADRGYLVFNVNYRLAPACGFPGQISDAGKAISWAYDHASTYGGDNRRIFLAGDSAGAQFSATYATAVHKPGLQESLALESLIPAECLRGLLLFYGAFDFDTVTKTGFPFGELLVRGFLGEEGPEYRRRVEVASPARHIGEDYPPAYLAVGSWDPMRTESVAFDEILTRAGIPHRTRIFPRRYLDGNHGFINFPFSACSRISLRESMEFLDELR